MFLFLGPPNVQEKNIERYCIFPPDAGKFSNRKLVLETKGWIWHYFLWPIKQPYAGKEYKCQINKGKRSLSGLMSTGKSYTKTSLKLPIKP